MEDVQGHVQQPGQDSRILISDNLNDMYIYIYIKEQVKNQQMTHGLNGKLYPPNGSTDQHRKQSHASLFEHHV